MLPRDRVKNTLSFKPSDAVPLEYHPSPRGFHEYGDRLKKLYDTYPGDFSLTIPIPYPMPSAEHIGKDGRYHEFKRDEWGTLWEYRLFCMHGHPVEWPLSDMSMLKRYSLPAQAIPGGKAFSEYISRVTQEKKQLFFKAGWISIFEKLIALRKFEDVLMDLSEDTDDINVLADLIAGYHAEDIRRLIEAGVDAVQFGDDYGTQSNLIMSPHIWRRFFKPRLESLIKPIKAANIKVFFHSCGMIKDIIDDLKEIGADAIWPQLNLYDNRELGAHCRDVGLSVAVHIDRAKIMTNGTPEDVRQAVEKAVNDFKMTHGGSWFYVEVDNGFPYENIQALITAISKYR